MKRTATSVKPFWHRFRPGVISSYFLAVFLYASLLTGTAAAILQSRLQTAANLRTANAYLGQEAVITRALQCDLKNQKTEDYVLQTGTVEAEIDFAGDTITVYVLQPHAEILSYEVHEGILYDYTCSRPQ